MASSVFHIHEHVVPCQYVREYARSTAYDQEATLSLVIKQYKPRNEPDSSLQKVTIIGGHGNGMPKELYEPLWIDLHEKTRRFGFAIESIWIADVANQGASGVLNEQKLGNDPSLFDHARDLMGMINHFRSEMPRPLIGIGHSLGGAILTQVALTHPRLFASLVLIEPIIFDVPIEDFRPALATIRRPEYWLSREEALSQCRRLAPYKTWDTRALDLWIKHGIRETPGSVDSTNGVALPAERPAGYTLTTTKHQELFTYLRPNYPSRSDEDALVPDLTVADLPQVPFYRPEPMIIFHNLPFLRPRTLFMFGTSSTFLAQPGLRKRLVSTTGTGVSGNGGALSGAVKELDVDGTHLVPLERPSVVADKAVESISDDLARWKKREEQITLEWKGREGRERRTVDEDMLRHLEGLRTRMKRQKL